MADEVHGALSSGYTFKGAGHSVIPAGYFYRRPLDTIESIGLPLEDLAGKLSDGMSPDYARKRYLEAELQDAGEVNLLRMVRISRGIATTCGDHVQEALEELVSKKQEILRPAPQRDNDG